MQEPLKAVKHAGTRRRPRAPIACLLCRSRRVRCDVSENGIPCSNCRFYKQECVVSEKKKTQLMFMRLGASSQTQSEAIGVNFAGLQPGASGTSPSNAPLRPSDIQSPAPCQGPKAAIDPERSRFSPSHDAAVHYEDAAELPRLDIQDVGTTNTEYLLSDYDESIERLKRPFDGQGNSPFGREVRQVRSEAVETTIPLPSSQTSTVPFSYYPFLTLKTMRHKSPEDISYLERNFCLRVPTPRILDIFMNCYFLHIHPHLPLLDEAEFWPMFAQDSSEDALSSDETERNTISLFVFQAMLFAASGFVSTETANDLGFSSVRGAREQFWSRAKLLFDFEVETNPISIAQGALLLAYHTATRSLLKTNTFWLEAAIRSAMSDDAHLYYNDTTRSPKERNRRKRVWWCCILRDRILPLGVRRALFITFEHFAFDKFPLTVEDFQEEIESSRVYDSATKRQHVNVMVNQCQLAIALTDTIKTLYPMQETPASCLVQAENLSKSLADITRCKAQLLSWYRFMKSHSISLEGYREVDGSVAVGTAMVYIYFYSATIGLCQFERLLLEEAPPQPGDQSKWQLQDCVWQFENAVDGITKHMNELIRLELAQYLPVSIGAYTALPLVLHLLDVRLTPQTSPSALKHRRLGVFLELFRIYEPRFMEIEFLWRTLRLVVDFLEIECPPTRPLLSRQQTHPQISDGSFTDKIAAISSFTVSKPTSSAVAPSKDWREIFSSKPHQYMPMALLLDLAMAQNKVPCRSDVFARLPKNSALARLFPSPVSGLRLGGCKYLSEQAQQSQLQISERQITDDTQEPQEPQEGGHVEDDLSWLDGLEDGGSAVSPTLVSALFDSI